jgi:hypothetical protein
MMTNKSFTPSGTISVPLISFLEKTVAGLILYERDAAGRIVFGVGD